MLVGILRPNGGWRCGEDSTLFYLSICTKRFLHSCILGSFTYEKEGAGIYAGMLQGCRDVRWRSGGKSHFRIVTACHKYLWDV